MNGILCVNKIEKISSFSMIYKIKKMLKVSKIGHAGTLDPNATGVLVVLLGDATKLSNYIMDEEKEYRAKVIIGFSTTTEDAEGEIVEERFVNSPLDVDTVLKSLIGTLSQVPPMYSAIKMEGKKLYELARAGEVVERRARDIEVYGIKRLSEIVYHDGICEFEFSVTVSKGTYIRTLCVEIGKRLGYPAHMSELERVKSGQFSISDSYTLDEIASGKFELTNMLEAMKKYEIISINDDINKKVLNGNKLTEEELLPMNTILSNDIVVLEYQNTLRAIYKKENDEYKAERVWK